MRLASTLSRKARALLNGERPNAPKQGTARKSSALGEGGHRMHNIPVNPAIRDLLSAYNIEPKFPDGSYDLGRVERVVFSDQLQCSDWTRHFIREGRTMIIGSLGYMSYAHSPVHDYKVGAYCSIADGVHMLGEKHPHQRVSTHPLSYGPFYAQAARRMGATSTKIIAPYNGKSKPPLVSDDVWIARSATLSGGIEIGTGAVVAAGSIVTKDVPPYAIVGGAPARIIKYRFAADIIARLLLTRWWEYPLRELADFSFQDPELFCDEFEARKKGLSARETKLVVAEDILSLA